MNDVAIRVENVSKKYRRGVPAGNDRLSEVAVNLGRRLLALPSQLLQQLRPSPEAAATCDTNEFWALNGVSFEAKRGEVVGIIGRNGAGKSTLLKVLSRITAPTSGRFGIRGRVASLLEVGTGFHGELTGRENTYLSGTLLGMGRVEIQKKFDEIVAFAELDDFLDTPVKRYSSGMYMRLAFAVAAHLEPEVLIVDEVLAVGDAAFQKKCIGKMDEVARGGRTILFVSHSMEAVRSLCPRTVRLEAGRVVDSDATPAVLDRYQSGSVAKHHYSRVGAGATVDTGQAMLLEARVEAAEPGRTKPIDIATELRLSFRIGIAQRVERLHFSILVMETSRGCIFNTHSDIFEGRPGIWDGAFTVPGNLLNNGIYSVRVQLFRDSATVIYDASDVLAFEIGDIERTSGWFGISARSGPAPVRMDNFT